jgi:hypothetical protein
MDTDEKVNPLRIMDSVKPDADEHAIVIRLVCVLRKDFLLLKMNF